MLGYVVGDEGVVCVGNPTLLSGVEGVVGVNGLEEGSCPRFGVMLLAVGGPGGLRRGLLPGWRGAASAGHPLLSLARRCGLVADGDLGAVAAVALQEGLVPLDQAVAAAVAAAAAVAPQGW